MIKTWLRRLSATLLTFMLAVTVMAAPAMAADLPGLQFAIKPSTGEFVQFQSGPIFEGEDVVVSYDSLRLASPANPRCDYFENLTGVKGYVMSDNSGNPTEFRVSGDYLKIGKFETPAAYRGSEEIQIWFVGDYGGHQCYDNGFGRNYSFSIITK